MQDFALEADEGQMRAGAHLIAGSLSGSLALATGKEPMRSALTTQLRAMLHNRLPAAELEAAIAVSAPCLPLSVHTQAGKVHACCVMFVQ